MYYSKTTGGFYTREIHGDNIPADAVEITVEEHQALLEGQSQGKRIVADENGYPILQDPPPPTAEQMPVPQRVTRAQGKAALIQAGLWQGVLDYVSSIEDETQRALAEVALHDTLHWERSSPFLNAAASALGLADEQLDDLFRQAAEIVL